MRHDDMPGFSLESIVAKTDQAILYDGKEMATGMPVIVKLVRNDRFGKNEVAMLSKVEEADPDGPVHVVRLLRTHECGSNLYMALERFDETLDHLDADRMTPLALMSIALGAARGLLEMHRAGVVDDDVKPANIAFKSASGRVAHIDLDCARLTGEEPIGYTKDYAAPEVMARVSSDNSPCYGWGRTMEFLACGETRPEPGVQLNEIVPWIGKAFAKLVERCCRPNFDERPSVPDLYECVKRIVRARVRCPYCNAIAFPDSSSCPHWHRT